MRICFFGDSIVNGTGDPDCLGWTGRLCSGLNHAGKDVTGYNLGVRRDTSRDVARRWRSEARSRLPDDVDGRLIFSFGINDCVDENGAQRLSPSLTRETAKAIFVEAMDWKPTLVVGPTPIADAVVNNRIARVSADLAQLCGELSVPYLDVFNGLVTNAVWMREVGSRDGAHPGAQGYAHLAGLVSAWRAFQDWSA